MPHDAGDTENISTCIFHPFPFVDRGRNNEICVPVVRLQITNGSIG